VYAIAVSSVVIAQGSFQLDVENVFGDPLGYW
jgi:hypothetical protein